MPSVVSSESVLEDGVEVGQFTIIHPGVTVKRRTVIGNFCELGSPAGESLVIGERSLVRSYTNIQGGSQFGPGLQTGQYTMIRGGTQVGRDLQVGSNCELQGSITIGDHVRIQSGVHLGKGTSIGHFVWIFPNVLTVNDPLPPSNIHLAHSFGDLSCVAANSLLMPGIAIGRGAFVGASSVVRHDVAEGDCVVGDPAKSFARIDRLISMEHQITHPWPRHFTRGLDEEGISRARSIMNEILEVIRNGKK